MLFVKRLVKSIFGAAALASSAAICCTATPANAIVYNFQNVVVDWVQSERILGDPQQLPSTSYVGQATISGSFDFNANSITNPNVIFNVSSNAQGFVANFTFTGTAQYTDLGSVASLEFSEGSGVSETFLQLLLSKPLTGGPLDQADIINGAYRNPNNMPLKPDQSSKQVYFGNFDSPGCPQAIGCISARGDASGHVQSVPAPFGISLLAPLSLTISFLRKRYVDNA